MALPAPTISHDTIDIADDLNHFVDAHRCILDDLAGALCVVTKEQHIIYANQAFWRLTNCEADSPPTTLAKLFPRTFQLEKKIECMMLKADLSAVSINHECVHTGEKLPYEIRVKVICRHSHAIGALISINEDVQKYIRYVNEEKTVFTQRIKTLSLQLKEKQALVRTLLDRSPIGIALLDKNRQVIQINTAAASILGLDKRKAVGLHCDELFQCYQLQNQCPVLSSGRHIDSLETGCAPCANRRNQTLLRSAILSQERDEALILEVFTDITELKLAEQAKDAAYRAKDGFFSKVSHELRTPLNVILGYADLILANSGNIQPQVLKEYMDQVKDGGQHLLHVIDQILSFQSVEKGNAQDDLISIDLRALLEEIIPNARTLEANNNRFEIINHGDVGSVYTHRNHLHLILQNLISNACQFTQNGVISLHVQHPSNGDDGLIISVRDNGIGIDVDSLERIFETFAQDDNALTRKHCGSGLGLAIVQRYAKLIGARITVKSTLGKGSEFSVHLPHKQSHPVSLD